MARDAELSDAERARVESRQMPIFPRDGQAVCTEIELGMREARKLYEDGLLSFDPESGGALDESREAELIFVGSIVSAGCTRSVLRQLLVGLHKPYCYDVRRIFFAWSTHEWRLLPGEDDPEGAFFGFLERLRERHAYEALLNVRGWVDEALELERSRTQMFARFRSGGTRSAWNVMSIDVAGAKRESG
jgi:hypothetical protein